MKTNKTPGLILGLITFFSLIFFPAFSTARDEVRLSADITSFMPDFYDFWEKAREASLQEKISLWDSLFESKHREFYEAVLYRSSGQDAEKVKARLLKNFLETLTDADVQRMKDKEGRVKELIPQAVDDLTKILPRQEGATSHYILPSLNSTSGSARPWKGDMVVYYGLEILSRFKKPADIKAVIAHETFHVLHFRSIFPYYREKYGENVSPMSILQGEGLLFMSFMEGLTVYAVEILYPGIFRPGLIEDNVPLYEKNFIPYTREFLKDLQEFNYRVYQKYFIDGAKDPVMPEKFGYWLGYSIVKSLAKEHTLQDMLSWTPDRSLKVMKEAAERIVAGQAP